MQHFEWFSLIFISILRQNMEFWNSVFGSRKEKKLLLFSKDLRGFGGTQSFGFGRLKTSELSQKRFSIHQKARQAEWTTMKQSPNWDTQHSSSSIKWQKKLPLFLCCPFVTFVSGTEKFFFLSFLLFSLLSND